MTREGKWVLAFSLFVLLGAFGQFLFTSAGWGWAWGVGLPLFLGALFLFTRLGDSSFPDTPDKELLKPPIRFLLFGLIAVLALFFGLFRISSLPPGLFIDQGALGLDALRLLKGHQWPSYVHLDFIHTCFITVLGLAVWFIPFKATALSLQLFFIVLYWIGLVLVFRFLRKLGSESWAAASCLILAIMPWYFGLARIGLPHVQTPFFTFIFLLLWWKALERGRMIFYVSAGLSVGLGLYSYQALKVLPLLVLLLVVYEIQVKRERVKWKGLLLMAGTFLVVAFPIVLSWWNEGSLGVRESELWIGKTIAAQKSLAPLLNNLTDWALMFNRREVTYPCMSSHGHRLLDDVSSFLFWIGVFWAFRHRKERIPFYLLSGLGVMSLPFLLSSDHLVASRIVGAAPFVAGLAALPVITLVGGAINRFGRLPLFLTAALAMAVIVSVAQNRKVYFQLQAGDRESWLSICPEATWVGERVVSQPDCHFYLTPFFWGHETVKYLCFDQSERVQPLNLVQVLRPGNLPVQKYCFAFEQGKQPTLALIQQVYPGGHEEDLKDPWGVTLAYLYYWEPGPGREVRPIEKLGLLGRYFLSGDGTREPFATRWDTILNFTHLGDFPLPGPLFTARWTGLLNVPQKGKYSFFILTTDHGKLWLDGRQVEDTTVTSQAEVELNRGEHKIEILDDRLQPGEIRADFHLLWKTPGNSQFNLIPETAYGKVPSN